MISRNQLLKNPVEDIYLEDLLEIKNFSKLIDIYRKMGGFSVDFLVNASEILIKMLEDNKCKIFLGFTANLIATGLRGLISSLLRYHLVDTIITTGGTIDHDIARALGGKYYKGKFQYDDKMLKSLEIHRLGNILVPVENYGPIIERFTHETLETIIQTTRKLSPSELLREIGKRIPDKNSILYQAAINDIPIFSPGIVDSAFGTALFTYNEHIRAVSNSLKNFELDIIKDLKKISDIVFDSKKMGAIILGGGISKHHIIWWSQFKGGLDYAIYITTAVEWDGSLSGAKTREAISWGKLKPEAEHVNLPGDATILFPLLIGISAQKIIQIKRR